MCSLVRPTKIPEVTTRQVEKSTSDPMNQNANAVAKSGTKRDMVFMPLENYLSAYGWEEELT